MTFSPCIVSILRREGEANVFEMRRWYSDLDNDDEDMDLDSDVEDV